MTETKTTPMHKLACALVALVMAIGICVPTMAFAADEGTYTIEIDPAYSGQTYTAYKVFDATYSGEGKDLKVSYTISSDSVWYAQVAADGSAFDLVEIGETGIYSVTLKEGLEDAEKAVIATLSPVPDDAVVAATVTVDLIDGEAGVQTTVTLDVSDETTGGVGYYFVTTSLGSAVSIDSTTPHVTVGDKNTPPTVTKEVVDEDEGKFEEGDSDGKQDNAKVGDTLEYKITIDHAARLAGLCLHDTATEGLHFAGDEYVTVYVTDAANVDNPGEWGAPLEAEGNYTIADACDDNCIFEIDFTTDFLDSLSDDDVIIVTYEVTVTEAAYVVHGNSAWAVYGANGSTTTTVTTETDTYGFELLKIDGDDEAKTPLDGATFTLADSEGELIQFVTSTYGEGENAKTIYIVYDAEDDPEKTETTTTSIEVKDGDVYIFGLEAGEYTLTETVAPNGYNILTDPITVTIEQTENGETWTVTANGVSSTGSVDSAGVITWPTLTVENNSGDELPSTGGMGTTIFYIIGGILVVGAVVLLITRRRMNNRAE